MKFHMILMFPALLFAQWNDATVAPAAQPRALLGGQASYFRISVHNFEDVYASRWGESGGGFAGVRVFGAHYATFKYGVYRQGGKTGIHPTTGEEMQNAQWDEKWYKIGLRIHPAVEKKWGSYYGFGLGFFDVKEAEPFSIFQKIGEGSGDPGMGTGFYLELGVDYFIMQRLAAFFEMEISSGGTRGRSSFEAMSVGGWLFSLGLSWWPF
ncbi:outer membrane beta-barrel protein [candidate division KSB1 bacterium]|nr:outer membrane beta-barrel protein [candidate division KSB1 bacterium]